MGCTDKLWCNEGAMCWDDQLQQSSPCTHVDLHLGSTPTYIQCPGSPLTPAPPTPGSFSYVLTGDKMRCHPSHRTSSWGDLGKPLTEDQCQEKCNAMAECKFFSMRISRGECTSFTACDRVQANDDYKVWEKVPATPAPTDATTTSTPSDIVEECVYAQGAPEFTEEYTEAQYWIDVCLREKRSGYESCQECTDKMWCDERALCWDPDIRQQVPCKHADHLLGSYSQCPCVYAQEPAEFTEEYTEAMYWIDVCLRHNDGYESCQECTDKLWCNEGAMCWDDQLQQSSPCTHVDLHLGSIPTYIQCPGSPPTPAPPTPALPIGSFSYVLTGDKMRCHPSRRTSTWGDLGKPLTEEQCQEKCNAMAECKFFSMRISKGECTSFTACDRVQANEDYKVWEKVESDSPARRMNAAIEVPAFTTDHILV